MVIHTSANTIIVFVSLQLVILSCNLGGLKAARPGEPFDDEIHVPTFTELAQQHGRTAEWHNVTTQDGYILSVFRLPPNSVTCKQMKTNHVVFLQHGITGSADFFTMFGPNKSLAYALSDVGYDVWLGNTRGNPYSKRHKSLLINDNSFWNFSLDEIALLDLPAMIDYVLQKTGQSKLSFIGHSSGSTAIMMLLANQTSYNDKIDVNVMLAPIVFWTTPSLVRDVTALPFRLVQAFIPSGAAELLSRNVFLNVAITRVCNRSPILWRLCYVPLELLGGSNPEQLTEEILAHFSKFYPAGAPLKIFYHYIQHMDSGKFQQYDYGKINFKYYGQAEPPEYNLDNIRVRSVILHAQNDPLSPGQDVDLLIKKLRNSPTIFQVIESEKFNHIDFLVAKDAKKLVHDPLIKILTGIHGMIC